MIYSSFLCFIDSKSNHFLLQMFCLFFLRFSYFSLRDILAALMKTACTSSTAVFVLSASVTSKSFARNASIRDCISGVDIAVLNGSIESDDQIY